MLLCLLSSSVREERELAVREILRIRNLQINRSQNRKFTRSDHLINRNATTLIDLPLSKPDYEPPFCTKMSDSQLSECVKQPLVPNIPLTMVSVERAVSDTTRASKMAVNDKSRNGIIIQTLRARQKRPKM